MVENMYGTGSFRVLLYHPSVLIRNSYRNVGAPIKWPPGTPDGTTKLILLLNPYFMEQQMTLLADWDAFIDFRE